MDMIKSDTQRQRTVVQLAGFRRALTRIQPDGTKRSRAVRASYEGVIRQLEDELSQFDELEVRSQRACRKLTWPDGSA